MTAHVVRNRFRYAPEPVIHTLRRLGLLANLQLCLDAGDRESYATGQSWLDRSGGGYDFFLGADGTATVTDPTFNGPAHGRSRANYFSFDGGDYFTYDTTNETWMQNLHKDNAIATILVWMKPVSFVTTHCILGSAGASGSTIGVRFEISTTGRPNATVANSGTVLSQTSAQQMIAGLWQCVGMAWDEGVGVGGITWSINGARDTDTSTYTSPSASDATFTTKLCATGTPGSLFISGSLLAMICVWEGRKLTNSELIAFFTATKPRFSA